MCPALDKVIGPDVIAPGRSEADARSVVQLETTPLRLFVWNLEPLAPPDALDTLVAHPPFNRQIGQKTQDRNAISRPEAVSSSTAECVTTCWQLGGFIGGTLG